MKVKAHLHLPRHKSGVDEVISVAPFAFRKGDKTEYFGTVSMTNVRFKVSLTGRQRTLDTGVKNVHAWVVGDMVGGTSYQQPPKYKGYRLARYNPRFGPDFVDSETGQALHSAKAAYMVGNKVYYLPEES
jgi:hypothetical protein